MSGFRPRNPRSGDRAEYLGTFLLSWVAQTIPIPRQEDYGIDFRGGLLWADEQRMVIGRQFAVQLKSNVSTLFKPIGAPQGRRGKKTWQQDSVKWLLGRPPYPVDLTPLFLGHVDLTTSTLELYSTAPMWNARWLGFPTEIEFVRNVCPPVADPDSSQYPVKLKAIDACYPKGYPQPVPGLEQRAIVPVGHPVVRLSVSDMAGPGAEDLRTHILGTLDEWIRLDTLNRLAATLEVPVCFWHVRWTTNVAPGPAQQKSCSYANNNPGEGLPAIEIERNLHPFVQAWLRVRTIQNEPSPLDHSLHRNTLLDELGSDSVGRATEVSRLDARHGHLDQDGGEE